MSKEHILRNLLEEKRGYESLLALHAAGRGKSSTLENTLKGQLQQVRSVIEEMLKVKPQAQCKCHRQVSIL